MKSPLIWLVTAALLEAGGDALIRTGLAQPQAAARIAWMAAGALALLAYGTAVNMPGWDFGRLLGAYVAAFFLVAQVINLIAFNQMPTTSVVVGGALIVAGGWIVAAGG